MSAILETELPGTINTAAAWYGKALQDDDSWIELLSVAEREELLAAVAHVNANSTTMLGMKREDFPLPTLAPRLSRLSRELVDGRGFWLLRGLPLERMTERDAAFAYWGIGLHLGMPVSQNARGHLLGHVTDEGVEFKRNNGARGYQTRLHLPFHTDSSEAVGLLCLQPAKSGGASSVASTTSVYNEVLRRRPDLAYLWFADWLFDRRNEEQPGEAPFYRTRLAHWDGQHLAVRYVRPFLESAQRHDAVPPHTTEQTEFLDLVDEIANEPGVALKMDFRPGDMQFISNDKTFHSRTAYEDYDDPERKRHLLRLWLALHGGRPMPPDFGRSGGTVKAVPGTSEAMAGTYV